LGIKSPRQLLILEKNKEEDPMKHQTTFANILSKKMRQDVFPHTTAEVHSVDETLSPEFIEVFGRGTFEQQCKGLRAYGVA
tara:strand:- start:1996 stop:2238 length:243 start_codon:yes stop_codon:yes gene_type:complete